jgi:hypothetical protein
MTVKFSDPAFTVADSPGELAAIRAAYVAGYVNAVFNYERAHGMPERMCVALQPSLFAAMGAWFDQHFTSSAPGGL